MSSAAVTMRRAAALVGGVEALAGLLDVDVARVLRWISGQALPDERASAKARAVVQTSDTQRFSLRGGMNAKSPGA